MEPSDKTHPQKASYQSESTADVGNRAHSPDSPECYMKNIFCFHPDNLALGPVQWSDILLFDKQRHPRMFSSTRTARSMLPIQIQSLRHPGLYNFPANINLLHAVVYVAVQDAAMGR